MRSTPLWLASLALTVGAGCAFDDGEPWGALSVELTASAPLAFRTAQGVSVELDDVELTVDAVEIYPGDAAAEDFDPANPPEDCTLCHGGHCHCGDALVTYAELAARSTGDTPPLVTLVASDAIALTDAPAPVPLTGCAPACDLPRATVTRARVTLTALTVRGRAGDDPVDLTVALDAPLDTLVEIPFDRDHDPSARLTLTLRLPPELLDGIEWDPMASPDPIEGAPADTLADGITDNIATHTTLTATVVRGD